MTEPHQVGYSMIVSNAQESPGADTLDLTGIVVLLVEDSWHLGVAVKRLLQLRGAQAAGPAATSAEADRLVAERTPDVALVDFNLRDNERADGLIDRLHARGVPVIVTSGYAVFPMAPEKIAAFLQKPVSEAQLVAALRAAVAGKASP